MAQNFLRMLRRLNVWVAVLVGVMLMACAAFILLDILLRQVGSSFGGSDEVSGYAMAVATSWGMAYAMLELGHVRIDLLRSRLATRGRIIMDLVSMMVVSATITLIATQCWTVVASSIKNASTANTPLETPLALVQIPWIAGWIWFALMAWLTLVAATVMTLRGQFTEAEGAIGAFAEQDALT